MAIERPKSPYQEVTAEDNAEIHGSLKDRTWQGLQILRSRARFLRAAGYDWAADGLEDFNQGILRTSGSIDGDHRKDTVQAIQGQKGPTMALVGQPVPQVAPKAAGATI